MGTITLSVADAEFDDGENAQGTEVLAIVKDVVNYINNGNIDFDNVDLTAAFPWTGIHTYTVNSSGTTNWALVVEAVLGASVYGHSITSAVAQTTSALIHSALTNASSTQPLHESANAGTGSTYKSTNTGSGANAGTVFEAVTNDTTAEQSTFVSEQKGLGHNYEGKLRTLTGLNAAMTCKTATGTYTVANDTTETAFSDLVTTLPANFLKIGTTIEIEAWGLMTTAGSPGTLQMEVKYGDLATGTVLLDTGAITPTSSQTNALVHMRAILTCITTGATGTIEAQGIVAWDDDGAPAHRGMGTGATGLGNTAAITIDTTAQTDLNLSVTWGSAVSGDSFSWRAGSVKILR